MDTLRLDVLERAGSNEQSERWRSPALASLPIWSCSLPPSACPVGQPAEQEQARAEERERGQSGTAGVAVPVAQISGSTSWPMDWPPRFRSDGSARGRIGAWSRISGPSAATSFRSYRRSPEGEGVRLGQGAGAAAVQSARASAAPSDAASGRITAARDAPGGSAVDGQSAFRDFLKAL